MRGSGRAVGLVLAVCVVVGLAGCVPRRVPDAFREPAPCRDGTLSLRVDPAIAFQATGDRGDAFTIGNRSRRACRLMGYPTVTLRDRRATVVPFHYTEGGGEYVTHRRPQPVVIRPGGVAYVAVAKYRCDRGDQTPATVLTMLLPGQRAALTVRLTGRALNLAYCRGGPHDPGNTVGISPVEAAANRTQF